MIGKRINGRYKIISRIGDGGMAVVYKAQDLILDRYCAVKILRQQFSMDDAFIRRFRREAEAVASLPHPNIVNIYDIGEEEDLYYIVMEYIDGTTLKTYIKNFAPVPPENAVFVLKQIASAIEHAHQYGIIHRDIKPQNILIDDQDHVKVTDFGIAMGLTSTTITYTNSIMGSAHYISPEQARGEKATVKSDIYAFGIVMYEMLTGQLPFSGDSPVSVALKHLNDEIIPPKDLNPGLLQSLENIIFQALDKNPDDRYENMSVLYDDLSTALNPERMNEPSIMSFKEVDPDQTLIMSPLKEDRDAPSADNISSELVKNKEQETAEKAGEPPVKKGKKNKKKRVIIWLSIVILALIVVAIIVIPKWLQVDNVQVPKVKGLTYEQAKERLEDKKLVVKKKAVYDDASVGVVVSQDPSSGVKVKEHSKVNLTVSKGLKKEVIQDYVGDDIGTVKELIDVNKYKDVNYMGVSSSKIPKGQIISQTPEAGSKKVPKNTVLKLTYSTGPKQIDIPNVQGDTKGSAEIALENAGFEVAFAEGDFSDSVPEGSVLKTDPSSGGQAEEGTTITVYLSKGKEERPKTTVEQITVTVNNPTNQTQKGQDADNGNGGQNDNQTSNNDNASQPINVVIYYTDAKHDHAQFVNGSITNTKVYNLPLTIDPGSKANYQVYKDGQLIEDKTIRYNDID